MSSSRKSASASRRPAPARHGGAPARGRNTADAAPRSRRPWLLAAALVAVAAAGAGTWWILGRTDGPPAPIILVSVDTMRADHLPVYGYTKVKTPAIDALARDGVVFERAYAHSPQTLPSHAAILVGPAAVRERRPRQRRDSRSVPTSRRWRRCCGRAGYRDRRVRRAPSCSGRRRESAAASRSTTTRCRRRRPTCRWARCSARARDAAGGRALDGGARPRRSSSSSSTSTNRTRPTTPPARFSQYQRRTTASWPTATRSSVSLVTWLKAKGWYDRATIIFLSDHGEGLGDHGELEHGLFLYDSTIRVPLIVKMPGNAGGGRRVSEPVQHIDLVPTHPRLARRRHAKGTARPVDPPAARGRAGARQRRASTRRRSTAAITSGGASCTR